MFGSDACATHFFFLFFSLQGKSICDGVSGVTKNQLVAATARENQKSFEVDDPKVKKFAAHTMVQGKAVSPAEECKRMIEWDGTEGKESVRKYQKSEQHRAIEKMHYWVRNPSDEILSHSGYP